MESAAQRCGFGYERIGSGAGHDACHVALKAPTGMIFVPCEDGLSHNEAESIEPDAAGRGAEVLLHAALELAGTARTDTGDSRLSRGISVRVLCLQGTEPTRDPPEAPSGPDQHRPYRGLRRAEGSSAGGVQ